MGYMSFQEYVEKAKGDKPSKKAPVKTVADYDGPHKDAPEKGDMPKEAGGIGQQGKPAPYKGGKDAPDPNKGKNHDGLSNKGDKKLEIKHKGHTPSVELKDLGHYPPKGKGTSEWVAATKNLSLPEFASKIRQERFAGLAEGSRPLNSIQEAVSVCKANANYIKDTVIELKRAGLFEAFFATMAQTNEALSVLAKIVEADENYFAKLLEMVAPPVGDEDAEEGEEGEEGEEHHGEDGDKHHGEEDHEDGDEHGDEDGEEGEGHEDHADAEEEGPPEPAESGAAMALKKAFMRYMSNK